MIWAIVCLIAVLALSIWKFMKERDLAEKLSDTVNRLLQEGEILTRQNHELRRMNDKLLKKQAKPQPPPV